MLKGIHLTLLAGPVVPFPVPQPVLEALTEVEVTSATGTAGGFQLRFTIQNKSPLQQAFLVAATQMPLMRVILVATINLIPHVLMDGVITTQEISSGEQPGESTLTITGEDLTKVMDLQAFDGLPYPAMPDNVRVMTILAKYAVFGMIPLVIPPIAFDVPIPTMRIPSQQGTDLNYILELARKSGYVFYVEPGPAPGTNTAYWGPQIKVGIPQPALNVDMDFDRNVESLNFQFNSSKKDLPIVMIHNALTKMPIPIPIPDINPLQPPLGLVGPPVTKLTMLKATGKLSPPEALSEGLTAASESMEAVTGSGSLDVGRYGRLLKARSLVGVRGAGLAFDGLYYVDNVTTTIKRGSCKQNFRLTRNGLVSITPMVPV
ncbi:MAG: hypothetical protein JNM35_00070 [Nitrospira sp.]|nr:hypothetical protein [Nitrospira sp.]